MSDGGAPLRVVAWSDYLCPWCANASVRLASLERDLAGAIEIEWRSFLLRPHPRPPARTPLEAAERRAHFRRYTQGWARAAAEPDAAELRPWSDDEDGEPPSHSMPPHLVARAARRIDRAGFARLHEALFRAYFAEHRDTTDAATLRDLWVRAGLPATRFEESLRPGLRAEVVADHRAALEIGATAVPAVALGDDDVAVVGAQPLAVYRRWIERALARRGAGAAGARPASG